MKSNGKCQIKQLVVPTILHVLFVFLTAGCSAPGRSIQDGGPHLQPVPSHLSSEAKSFLKRTRKDINDNYVQKMGSIHQKAAPEFRTVEAEFGGVKCFWATSPETTCKDVVVVYFHGGSYMYGSGQEAAGVLLPVFEGLGVRGLSVDYRLAPQHPFPAAVNDAVAVYRALLEQGYAPEKIAFAGDSAGGGLALAATHFLRDSGDPLPGAIAVIGPWVDLPATGDSIITMKDWDTWLDLEDDKVTIPAYAGNHDLRNPLISPLYGDFTGFPPLLVQAGTREIDLSECVLLAQKARRQGVDVTLDVWDGMWHVWHMTWPDVHEARQACHDLAAFLREHLKDD
jgi:monoterpene epsilon-lactone hydrolase